MCLCVCTCVRVSWCVQVRGLGLVLVNSRHSKIGESYKLRVWWSLTVEEGQKERENETGRQKRGQAVLPSRHLLPHDFMLFILLSLLFATVTLSPFCSLSSSDSAGGGGRVPPNTHPILPLSSLYPLHHALNWLLSLRSSTFCLSPCFLPALCRSINDRIERPRCWSQLCVCVPVCVCVSESVSVCVCSLAAVIR